MKNYNQSQTMKTNNGFYKSNVSEIFVIYIHIIKLNGHTALIILENLNVQRVPLISRNLKIRILSETETTN